MQDLAADGDQYSKRILDTRPPISKALVPFFTAYFDLLPEGNEFNGIITWRSVANYCSDLGLPGTYMEFMFDILRAAQSAVEKWQPSNSKK